MNETKLTAGAGEAQEHELDDLSLGRRLRENFGRAYAEWVKGGCARGTEAEGQMLRALVPLLNAMSSGLPEEDARPLFIAALAIEDAIEGNPWPSFQRPRGGNPDTWQRRTAKRAAISYVQSAKAGKFDDTNPTKTAAGLCGVTPRAVQEWVQSSEAKGEVLPCLALTKNEALKLLAVLAEEGKDRSEAE